MAHHPAYDRLTDLFQRQATLDEAQAMLHWDASAMMPVGGAEARARQLALLKSLSHAILTSGEVKDLLDAATAESLSEEEEADVREMRRDWLHAAAVPSSLVEALSHACSASEMAWREARRQSDFAGVVPELARVVALTRDMAGAKAEALGLSPYDALLDQYEPGGRSAEIDRLFDDLSAFLPGFVERLPEAPEEADLPAGPFPVVKQNALAAKVMGIMGFEFEHGRLDISQHPFCGGTPDDVRITTRYDEADFLKSLMGVIHETGHALYERGLPAGWRGRPIGRVRSMSVHESQSLLMEMQVCRGQDFIAFAAPLIRAAFEGEGAAWSAEALGRAVRRIEPGFIRVDADEVTYPLHVILRYRLEKALVAGDLDVAALPSAWNEGFARLFGRVPENDRLGCLQDIHWYDGAIGYFPTYTLGALTAAQLYQAAIAADPAIPGAIRRGDFAPLLAWLRTNVHGRGSALSTGALLAQATGSGLDVAHFKAHLARRYL